MKYLICTFVVLIMGCGAHNTEMETARIKAEEIVGELEPQHLQCMSPVEEQRFREKVEIKVYEAIRDAGVSGEEAQGS